MSETYVIDIATGDTVQNKIATVLNQAGSSARSPILKGLGFELNVKLTPDVHDHEVLFGLSSPAEDRILSLVEKDTDHFRLRGAIGESTLGFDVDYTDAQRHFIRVNMTTPSHVQGTERELWIRENPIITAYLAGASFAWCDEAAAAYFILDQPSQPGFGFWNAVFNPDPGPPPNTDVIPAGPTSQVAQVELNADRIVEFGVYGTGTPELPIVIPITIMDDWKDEFNQKHFGGAKYVSIFEQGLAEDAQGTFITNRYQVAVETVTDISILNVDSAHEYNTVFRFRSELNDPFYVDKVVRFKVATADDLTRSVSGAPFEDDFPEIIYDAATNKFFWSDAVVFTSFGPFSVVETWIIKGADKVSLPIDAVTPFVTDFTEHRSVIHGGELVVLFRRENVFFTELAIVTYQINRPAGANSLPITVSKKLFRKHSMVLGTTNFDPDTQFRLVQPDTPDGTVQLEVLNLHTVHVVAVVWTDKGSLALDTPLKAGAIYDVTDLFDVDPVTGKVQQGVINILLATEYSVQVIQEKVTVVRDTADLRSPPYTNVSGDPAADFVLPILTPDYPTLGIEWPTLTNEGDPYTLLGYDDSDPSAVSTRFFIKGRKSILAIDGMSPGSPLTLFDLSLICYPNEETFEIIYSVDHAFASDVQYVNTLPIWEGYDAVPPPQTNSGLLQAIAYATVGALIFTDIPPNFISVLVEGNLGSKTYNLTEIVEDQAFDLIGATVWDGVSASVDVTYQIYNPTLDANETFGPFTIPKFEKITTVPTTEINLSPTIWRPQRLVEVDQSPPRAKIVEVDKTLEFDYANIATPNRWLRWKATNPLDGTQVLFPRSPANRVLYDVRRCFREDSLRQIQQGNFIVVTFLHETGAHKVVLYKITGEFVSPVDITDLRGQF